MAGYCICSIEKIHALASLQARNRHNLRDINMVHIDEEKSMLNEKLVDTFGLDYNELWKQRIKNLEIKNKKKITVRKNAVLAYELVLSFSKDTDVDLKLWKEANLKWLKEYFGVDNLIAANLHMDETTPHIHAIVIPIDENQKLCARSFTGGREKMLGLQSSYGKAMKTLGLKRGIKYSRAKKSDLNRFYSTVDNAVNSKVPEPKENEDILSYSERVNHYIQDINIQHLKETQKYIKKIDAEKTYSYTLFKKHEPAIKLEKEIEKNFHTPEEVKERLNLYEKIEKSVPKNTLTSLLLAIIKKFSLTKKTNNILEPELEKDRIE